MASGSYINGLPGRTAPAPAPPDTTSRFNTSFSALYPNLDATQGQASANTLSQLRGELSPETLNAIQDSAARFGISSGMPLGGGGNTITGNFGRKLVGQTSQGLQSQGLQNYLNTLQGYSGTLMPTTGETIGAETSRYSTDVGAGTAANALSEQARGTNINAGLKAAELGIQGANVGANYLNSYLSFLK